MKVFICRKPMDSLEFGCLTVAESETEAKKQIKRDIESQGWSIDLEELHLVEVNTSIPSTFIIDTVDD